MSQYGWADCPDNVRTQVNTFLETLREILEDNLVGIYLHGSLAMGCFNPERSDIDLLIVTRHGMTVETKRTIAELLLRSSMAPSPIEISFLVEQQIRLFQHRLRLASWSSSRYAYSSIPYRLTCTTVRVGVKSISRYWQMASGRDGMMKQRKILIYPLT